VDIILVAANKKLSIQDSYSKNFLI